MIANRIVAAAALAGAFFCLGTSGGSAQVVAEPAMLTAGVPSAETFQAYIAIPENSFVLGGMIRFPVSDAVDLGGRAGLWFIDGGEDTPFAGGDLRYGLLSRRLSPGGGLLNLSFDVGLGISDPGETVWKIPLGFITGLGFSLAGGDSEIFAHPRFDIGMSSGDDSFDAGLLLDVGGVFTVRPPLAVTISFRFGEGPFGEGDNLVLGLGAIWRL